MLELLRFLSGEPVTATRENVQFGVFDELVRPPRPGYGDEPILRSVQDERRYRNFV